MKKLRSGNILFRGLLVFLAAFAATGCIKESITDCPVNHSLIVRAYDAAGNDITDSGEVSDVSLYIFDREGVFQERREVLAGTRVDVKVPVKERIQVVGWANASGTNELFPDLIPGQDRLGDQGIGLRPATTRANLTFYDSPDDLFQGVVTIAADDTQKEHILPIKRNVGSMSITIRKLREFTQCFEDDHSIVVRETKTGVAFEGGLTGERTAAYRPNATFTEQGIYLTGIFRMLPDSEGISIDIYHGSELIRTVYLSKGELITVAAGVTTNVLIDFGIYYDVRVSVTEWNAMEIWRDF